MKIAKEEMPLRILHLEDNPEDAELIQIELQMNPLAPHITLVADREQFVAKISSEPFDLVLADFKVPDIHSFEAVMIVQQHAMVCKIPFIYVSGAIGEEHAIEALKAGATDYVLKSNLEKLPLAIERAILEYRKELAIDKAHKALEEREKYLQNLLENVPVSILNINEQLEVTFLNHVFNSRKKTDDLIGMKLLDIVVEAEKAKVHKKLMELVERKRIINYETQVIDENGTERYVYCIGAPIIGGKDSQEDFVITSIDITEKKNAEKEVLRQYGELQNFVYIISHNIRSPISTLLSLTQIFEKGNEVLNQDIIDRIDTTVHVLDETIKDLNQSLSFKKASDALVERVSLKELTDELSLLMAEDIQSSKAMIETDFSNVPVVNGNKSYFMNIFYNLVDNAIKYKKKENKPKIFLKSQPISSETVEIIVTDNGLGMDLTGDREKRIFDMYGRLSKEHQGKGMGLYLVKKQIESMGGSINVTSELGNGTTFTLIFTNDLNVGKNDK